MSGSGGASMARTRGEDRFYVSPAMRKQKQQQQQQQQKTAVLKNCAAVAAVAETEKRAESDQCGSSASSSFSLSSKCSLWSRAGRKDGLTNLDRFLEYTTPVVPAQLLPKTIARGWRSQEPDCHTYFVLGDLWESFQEWSAYGVGVPLLLDGSETAMQYYVPYLSGIQLYIDPSRPSPRLRHLVPQIMTEDDMDYLQSRTRGQNILLQDWMYIGLTSIVMVSSSDRRPGEESDADSSRETSSQGSSDSVAERGASNVIWGPQSLQSSADAKARGSNGLSRNNKPLMGSSSDECEISNPPGRLVFEYMEYASPFIRQPLVDKISVLALQFPELKTYRSCDLSPSSWISVAWYPIYRIPMGPTLQNLDACFLTFHSLSTSFQGQNNDGMHPRGSGAREVCSADMIMKLPLPSFGLASYKFRLPFWIPSGAYESQKVNSLLRAADNWLRLLKVNHPDFGFFVSHNSSWR